MACYLPIPIPLGISVRSPWSRYMLLCHQVAKTLSPCRLEDNNNFITPLFKNGASSAHSNYCPISLISVFSKLMRRVKNVLNLLNYLRSQNLISRQQHGSKQRSIDLLQGDHPEIPGGIGMVYSHFPDSYFPGYFFPG